MYLWWSTYCINQKWLGGRSDRSRIIESQCEWGIRIVLFAKNNPLDCFFNAQTYRFDSSFSMHNKKGTLKGTFSAVVGVTGVEPAASCSQSKRATICATPRSMYFFVSPDSIYYFILFVNRQNRKYLVF